MNGLPNKSAVYSILSITNMSIHHPSLNILFPDLLGEAPVQGKPPHVFCDVDGVLANFYEGMLRELGVPKSQVNDFLVNKGGWEIISEKKPNLFAVLPLLPDAKKLMSGLITLRDKKRIKLSILTAIPDEWYHDPTMRKVSTQDKVRWITRFFQTIPPQNVLVVRREDKQKYAKAQQAIGNPPAVLIDDLQKNIREWEMVGGVGIHHTSSINSLQRLVDHLN